MTKPCIIMVTPKAQGGLLKHVQDVIRLLCENGYQVQNLGAEFDVSVLSPQVQTRYLSQQISITEDAKILPALKSLLLLRKIITQTASNSGLALVIHAHGFRAGALSALAKLCIGKRGRQSKLVVTLHNQAGAGTAGKIAQLLWLLCAKTADLILAVSPDLLEQSQKYGAKLAMRAVIPARAVNPSNFAGKNGNELVENSCGAASAIKVLSLARLAPQKDLFTLLEAVKLYQQEALRNKALPQLQVEIAGSGPQAEKLTNKIAAEKLPVALLGQVTDTAKLMQAADVYVQSSRWEGQPVALQEAIKAHKAIIATNAGGTAWVTGNAAKLVPVQNPVALAEALQEFTDPKVRETYANRAIMQARQLPGTPELLAQLEFAYGGIK